MKNSNFGLSLFCQCSVNQMFRILFCVVRSSKMYFLSRIYYYHHFSALYDSLKFWNLFVQKIMKMLQVGCNSKICRDVTTEGSCRPNEFVFAQLDWILYSWSRVLPRCVTCNYILYIRGIITPVHYSIYVIGVPKRLNFVYKRFCVWPFYFLINIIWYMGHKLVADDVRPLYVSVYLQYRLTSFMSCPSTLTLLDGH